MNYHDCRYLRSVLIASKYNRFFDIRFTIDAANPKRSAYDPELIEIFNQLKNKNATIPFQIQNDMLYFHRYDGRILLVIPQATVPEILETYHTHEM